MGRVVTNCIGSIAVINKTGHMYLSILICLHGFSVRIKEKSQVIIEIIQNFQCSKKTFADLIRFFNIWKNLQFRKVYFRVIWAKFEFHIKIHFIIKLITIKNWFVFTSFLNCSVCSKVKSTSRNILVLHTHKSRVFDNWAHFLIYYKIKVLVFNYFDNTLL